MLLILFQYLFAKFHKENMDITNLKRTLSNLDMQLLILLTSVKMNMSYQERILMLS